MDSLEKTKAKLLAVRRAQWRLKQRLETIDYEHDVLKAEVEELKAGLAQRKLPQVPFGEPWAVKSRLPGLLAVQAETV